MNLAELEGRATIPLWPDAGRLLGLSKNTAYDAAKRGEIPGFVQIGRKHLVAVPAFLAWLEHGGSPVKKAS